MIVSPVAEFIVEENENEFGIYLTSEQEVVSEPEYLPEVWIKDAKLSIVEVQTE